MANAIVQATTHFDDAEDHRRGLARASARRCGASRWKRSPSSERLAVRGW